ncbi:MAG: PBS lyase [Thermoanaerobaculum sp.]|nr:MAG: PBS lyase [Thermoanaerobaculum sp.]
MGLCLGMRAQTWLGFGILCLAAGLASAAESLLRRLDAAAPATAGPLVEELAGKLESGEFYLREPDVARACLRLWRHPATPPEVLARVQRVLASIAAALEVQDPTLARTVFLEVPWEWLATGDPQRQQLAREVVRWACEAQDGEARFRALEALPSLLERAASFSDAGFEAVVGFLASSGCVFADVRFVRRYPPPFLRRLRAYRGPAAPQLPEILALDPTDWGTETMVSWAENPPPWVRDPGENLGVRWGRFVRSLSERSLRLEQKQRVVALLLHPEIRADVFAVVQAWWHRGEPLPPPPPQTHDLLGELALDPEACPEAVRLLAAAGAAGVERLLAMVAEDQKSWGAPIRDPRPCERDRWSSLFQSAALVANRILQAYRQNPAPWHLRLLAGAGIWEPVVEALAAGDPSRRREAAFLLALALAPEEEELARFGDAKLARRLAETLAPQTGFSRDARQALERALADRDPGVVREALRAYWWLGEERAWDALRAVLQAEDDSWFQSMASGLRLPISEGRALSLAGIAQDRAAGRARIRALAVLAQARPGAWQAAVEGTLRELLFDPEARVRQAAAEYFTAAPPGELATAAALLAAAKDPDPPVAHRAAMALGGTRTWNGALLARLEALQRDRGLDSNVSRHLEAAFLNALRHEPSGADRLLAIILHAGGTAAWRRALAQGPPASPAVAAALLELLAARPVSQWAPMPKANPENWARLIAFLVRAEEDPPPLSLLSHLVPPETLGPWLARRALGDRGLALEHRLWLLEVGGSIPQELEEAAWRAWLAAVRGERAPGSVASLLNRWGYPALKRLVNELWDEPQALTHAWRYLRRLGELAKLSQSAGLVVPAPGVEDLAWIEATLGRLTPGARDPRLEPVVDLLGLWHLGQYHRREVFRTRIPQLLLRHLPDPEECEAVAIAVGSIFGRGTPPRCPLPAP